MIAERASARRGWRLALRGGRGGGRGQRGRGGAGGQRDGANKTAVRFTIRRPSQVRHQRSVDHVHHRQNTSSRWSPAAPSPMMLYDASSSVSTSCFSTTRIGCALLSPGCRLRICNHKHLVGKEPRTPSNDRLLADLPAARGRCWSSGGGRRSGPADPPALPRTSCRTCSTTARTPRQRPARQAAHGDMTAHAAASSRGPRPRETRTGRTQRQDSAWRR